MEEVKEDIKLYKELEAVKNSDGGKRLIKSLEADVISVIDEFSANYKTLTHTEFIALSAKLSERLSLFRTLTRSSKNKKLAEEELARLLEEL